MRRQAHAHVIAITQLTLHFQGIDAITTLQKRACQRVHMRPPYGPPHEPYYRLAMTAAGKHQVSRRHPGGRRLGRAGIRDVAAAAGVSITTVSDALNGKGRLPDATRRHVREVADRLGYRPSAAARTLRTGKSGLIGLTVTTYGDEPFTFTEFAYFAEMARAATSAALARGYALVILPATSRHDVWSQRRPRRHRRHRPLRPRPGRQPNWSARACRSSPTAARPAACPVHRLGRQRPRGGRPRHPRPPRRRRRPPDRPAHRHQHRHLHPAVHHRLPGLVRTRRPGPGVRGLPGARPVRGRRRRRPAARPPRPARRRLRALRPQRHRPARRRPPLRAAGTRRPAAGLLQRVHRATPTPSRPITTLSLKPRRIGTAVVQLLIDAIEGVDAGQPGRAGDTDRTDRAHLLAARARRAPTVSPPRPPAERADGQAGPTRTAVPDRPAPTSGTRRTSALGDVFRRFSAPLGASQRARAAFL